MRFAAFVLDYLNAPVRHCANECLQCVLWDSLPCSVDCSSQRRNIVVLLSVLIDALGHDGPQVLNWIQIWGARRPVEHANCLIIKELSCYPCGVD